MTYKSQQTLTTMATSIALAAGYAAFVLQTSRPEQDALSQLKMRAGHLLLFIGIGIAAMIVIQILFHIAYSAGVALKERHADGQQVERLVHSAMVEDEMHRLIGLKAARVEYLVAGISFLAALAALYLGAAPVLALHIAAAGFLLGSLAGGGFSIYSYEKGIHNA